MYHEILTREDAPFLLSEFCCHHALIWMHQFRKHGLLVSLDECKAWDDSCCKLRIARPEEPGTAVPKAAPEAAPEGAPG